MLNKKKIHNIMGKITQKEKMKNIGKIILLIIAINLFLLGVVFTHVGVWRKSLYVSFFGVSVTRIFIFDLGFVCLAFAFSITIYLSFKPIFIIEKKEIKKIRRENEKQQ